MEHTESLRLFELLWEKTQYNKTIKPVWNKEGELENIVIHGEQEEEIEEQFSLKDRTCYAIKLMDSLCSLFFKENFTLAPPKKKKNGSDEDSKKKELFLKIDCLWNTFPPKSASEELNNNRMVLLEAIVTILSLKAHTRGEICPFIFYMIAHERKQIGFVKMTALSLITTALSYNENGLVPYIGHYYKRNNKVRVAMLASNISGLILTREHQIDLISGKLAKDFRLVLIQNYMKEVTIDVEKLELDLIESAIEKIKKDQEEFKYSVDHFAKFIALENDETILLNWANQCVKIIRNPYESQNTLLPGSVAKTELFDETIYLFQRLSHLNSRFRGIVVSRPYFCTLNYIIVYHLADLAEKGEFLGLFEILVTLLMDLSTDKNYCMNLNKTIQETVMISSLPIVSGKYLDLIFVCFSYLLVAVEVPNEFCFNYLAILKNL